MVALFANSFLIASAGILAGSLLLVRRLIKQLPAGRIRLGWRVLNALNLVFVGSYLTCLDIFWNCVQPGLDLIEPTRNLFHGTGHQALVIYRHRHAGGCPAGAAKHHRRPDRPFTKNDVEPVTLIAL